MRCRFFYLLLLAGLFATRAQGAAALYSIGDPTAEEQLYLEQINRARANPAAEGVRLAATRDPDVLEAIQFFGVDILLFALQMNALPPLPPLAFSEGRRERNVLIKQLGINRTPQKFLANVRIELATSQLLKFCSNLCL